MYHHLCICVFLSFILKALKKIHRLSFMQTGGSNREEGHGFTRKKPGGTCTVMGLLCERELAVLHAV